MMWNPGKWNFMKWYRLHNLLLSGIFIVVLFPLKAQPAETGSWLMYFGLNRISDNFSIHTEVQYRNHTALPVNAEQLLLRTGLNYHLSNDALVTAGYAYVPSYTFESEQSAPEVVEHRIWQQLIMYNKLGRIKFEHRYRVEQRWVNDDYKNRFRYRAMAFIPLNKPVMEPKTVFLGIYDELFINATSDFFDRNRLYGAIGYQFNRSTQLQAGLLHQQLSGFGKYYLQLAFIYNPDFRK